MTKQRGEEREEKREREREKEREREREREQKPKSYKGSKKTSSTHVNNTSKPRVLIERTVSAEHSSTCIKNPVYSNVPVFSQRKMARNFRQSGCQCKYKVKKKVPLPEHPGIGHRLRNSNARPATFEYLP